MEPIVTPYGKLAFEFAKSLVNGHFKSAHEMLSDKLKAECSLSELQNKYTMMVEYFEVPPGCVEVGFTMDNWPDKRSNDLGWAYASIYSEYECEGVTVIVCTESGKHVIREIEWGRP